MKIKITIFILFMLTAFAEAYAYKVIGIDTIPLMIKGNFKDDYGIYYKINDVLWTQLPKAKYHIISSNSKEQFLIAKNDESNSSEPGLYTRIDYMTFNNMEPFLWGFCLTTYNAKTIDEALGKKVADRTNPRKGCNGFPFSRMKRVN